MYGILENFCNGAIFVGKYQSKTLLFKPPHVIVFSNEEPKYEIEGKTTLSQDRWRVVEIKNKRKRSIEEQDIAQRNAQDKFNRRFIYPTMKRQKEIKN